MKATDILKKEHRVILRVLKCLAAAADPGKVAGTLDVVSIRKMLDFFRGFADRCHHGKEEAHFFPMARQRGVGCAPGNIDILLAEHEQGRSHVRAMDESLSALQRGDGDAKARLCEHAKGYVLLLTEHIDKEDNCLFPTADMMLSATDQQTLVRAFEEVEEREMGAGTHERFHALADELCAKWGIPAASTDESHGPG